MFKSLWKEDYDIACESEKYKKSRNIILYILLGCLFMFNWALYVTPANAYDGNLGFTVEDFSDYKDVGTCNYSLVSGSPGIASDMSCVTLGAAGAPNKDYIYVKSNDYSLYQAQHYTWVNADDLKTGKTYTYYDGLISSNPNDLLYEKTENGKLVYNPTDTTYLSKGNKTYGYYDILKFVPSWVSESKNIYNTASNGNLYYSDSNPNDAYYRYDKDGNLTYNKYAEISSVDVKYIYQDGNGEWQYGNPTVDGYYTQYVTLTNVSKATYKLQTYTETNVNTDYTGKAYGQAGFNSSSYYKDGVLYLWDDAKHVFYAYSINTLKDLGYISESDVKSQKEQGNGIITLDSAKNLISNVMKYRTWTESTYGLSQSDKTTSGTVRQDEKSSLVASSTGSTYSYYDIGSSPVSYDVQYTYIWTLVSDYLYGYQSDYIQQQYKYLNEDQTDTGTVTDTTTYSFQLASTEETKGDANPSYKTSCSNVGSWRNSGNCYIQTSLDKYDFSFTLNSNYYTNSSDTTHYTDYKLTNIGTKTVSIGNNSVQIYSYNDKWYKKDGTATFYNMSKNTTEYTFTRTEAGTVTSTNRNDYRYTGSIPTISDVINNSSPQYYYQFDKTTYTGYTNKYKYATLAETNYYASNPSGTIYNNNNFSTIKDNINNYQSYYVKESSPSKYSYTISGYTVPKVIKLSLHVESSYEPAKDDRHDDKVLYALVSSLTSESFYKDEETRTMTNKPFDKAIWSDQGTNITNFTSNNAKSFSEYGGTKNFKSGWWAWENKDFPWKIVGLEVLDATGFTTSTASTTISINTSDGKEKTVRYGTTQKEYNQVASSSSGYTLNTEMSTTYSAFTQETDGYTSIRSFDGTTSWRTIDSYKIKYTSSDVTNYYRYDKYEIKNAEETIITSYIKAAGTNNNKNLIYTGEATTHTQENTCFIGGGCYNPQHTWKAYRVSKTVKTNNVLTDYVAYNNNGWKYIDKNASYDKFYVGVSSVDAENNFNTTYSNLSISTPINADINGRTTTITSYARTSLETRNLYLEVIQTQFTAGYECIGCSTDGAKNQFEGQIVGSNLHYTVSSITKNGNGNLIINYTDSTAGSSYIIGTPYFIYNYYEIKKKAGVSGDINNPVRTGYRTVSSKEELFSTRNNIGNWNTAETSTKDNGNTTWKDGNGFNGESVETKVTTFTYKRNVYTFKGFVDTNNRIALYNTNSEVGKEENYKNYQGSNTAYGVVNTVLTPCSTTSTGICYRLESVKFNGQLTEITGSEKVTYGDIARNSVSQNSDVNYSKDINNAAYYKKHTANFSICANETQKNCLRDNPSISYESMPRYSYTKHDITYSSVTNNNTANVTYGNASANSNVNNYYEEGTITGATYKNDGSISGGNYNIKATYNDLTSKNVFNQYNWFLNSNVSSGLVKSLNNNTYNFVGNGTVSRTISITNGVTYTISFDALSSNNGTVKVDIAGNSKTFNLNAGYIRYSYSFTANGSDLTFTISNGMTIKNIAICEGSNAVFSEYATYVKGNVTNTFYKAYSTPKSFSWYDVTNNNTNYALINESKVIGYNNVIINQGGYEQELIKANESSKINTSLVLFGNDFNNDGVISANEKYSGTNVLQDICLNNICNYRYHYINNGANLTYKKHRILTLNKSTLIDYMDKASMTNVLNVNKSNVEGNENNINSNLTYDKTKYVMSQNGTYYSTSTPYGKYLLVMEYLNSNSLNESKDNYFFNQGKQSVYYVTDRTDYYKYLVSHDGNKSYNSINKTYDKLDSGYVTISVNDSQYGNYNTSKDLLEDIVKTIKSNYSYITTTGPSAYINSANFELTQEKLFALYSNEETKNYVYGNVKADAGAVESCNLKTCTFSLNKPYIYTLNDVLNDLVNSKDEVQKYYMIFNNDSFNNASNPYFKYNNDYFKFSKIGDNNYVEFEEYYYGGYWMAGSPSPTSYSEMNINEFGGYNSKALSIHKYKVENANNYVFFGIKWKEDNTYDFYTQNATLYIFRGNALNTTPDNIYSDDKNQAYYYAWVSDEVRDKNPDKYSNYFAKYTLKEVYDMVMGQSEDGRATHYITSFKEKITINGVTSEIQVKIALKETITISNKSLDIYKLQQKNKDVKVYNILNLASLQELDLSKSIDSDKLARSDTYASYSTSYALKFSGMMNYWNGKINGDDIYYMDGDDCVLNAITLKQKKSTITFGDETVSEFILQNVGYNGNKKSNIYDLYGLSQVLDNGEYYQITQGGSSGDNLITVLVKALNILNKYKYTGYMFESLPSRANIDNAKAELSALPKYPGIDWEMAAENPKLLQTWFGNSSYANLISDNTTDSTESVIGLYNARIDFTTSGIHYNYYKKYLEMLYSYYLYGYVYSNYKDSKSLPNADVVLRSTPEKTRIFTGGNSSLSKTSQEYKDYFDETINTLKSLGATFKYNDKANMTSKLYMLYMQGAGNVIDLYSYFDEYKYSLEHISNEMTVVTSSPGLMKYPSMSYGDSFDEEKNTFNSLSTLLNEINLTSLLDYVANNNSSDYIFVKSNSSEHQSRYYVYKKLESNQAANNEMGMPSITIIRQSGISAGITSPFYDYSNNLQILDSSSAGKSEVFTKALYDYIQTGDDVNWGSFWGWDFNSQDNLKSNKLYALINNGGADSGYNNLLQRAHITTLANYIYSSEMILNNSKETMYQPRENYYSKTSTNPVYYYKWINFDKNDVSDAVAEQCNTGFFGTDKGNCYEEMFKTFTNMSEFNSASYSSVLGSVFIGDDFYININNAEKDQLISSGKVMVITRGKTTPDGQKCDNDFCLAVALPFDYTINTSIATQKDGKNIDKALGLKISHTNINTGETLVDTWTYTFGINTNEQNVDLAPTYQNGHSHGPSWITNNQEHMFDYDTTVGVYTTEITDDTDETIGNTSFNVTIGNINAKATFEKNGYAAGLSSYEVSLSYKPKSDSEMCTSGYEYYNNACYFTSKNYMAIKSNNYTYKYGMTGVIIDDEGRELWSDESVKYNTIKLNSYYDLNNSSDKNKLVKYLKSIADVTGVQKVNEDDIVFIEEDSSSNIYNIINSLGYAFVAENLLENTEYTVKVRTRLQTGVAANEYVKTFTTGDDIVLNPYGTSIKRPLSISLTSDEVLQGLKNGNELLKNETIPYDLQKCIFTYDGTPSSVGTSICNGYKISNKYRTQVTADKTIKIGFALTYKDGNNEKVFTGNNSGISFVEDINAYQLKKHLSSTGKDTSYMNANTGIFYYEFNDEDFKEYSKEKYKGDLANFVSDYILKKYTIQLSQGLYSNLNNLNKEYSIKAVEYYDTSYTYVDYNQNGIYDENSLSLENTYYSKYGVQTFKESVNLTTYMKERLANSNIIDFWTPCSINVNQKFYSSFKVGTYKNNNVTNYYLFAYDKSSGSHIIK